MGKRRRRWHQAGRQKRGGLTSWGRRWAPQADADRRPGGLSLSIPALPAQPRNCPPGRTVGSRPSQAPYGCHGGDDAEFPTPLRSHCPHHGRDSFPTFHARQKFRHLDFRGRAGFIATETKSQQLCVNCLPDTSSGRGLVKLSPGHRLCPGRKERWVRRAALLLLSMATPPKYVTSDPPCPHERPGDRNVREQVAGRSVDTGCWNRLRGGAW